MSEQLIRFACNSLCIKKKEFAVLKMLINYGLEFRVVEIAKAFDLERSTVQKIVTQLFRKNLVRKRQVNLDSGGYVFLYSAEGDKVLSLLEDAEMRHHSVFMDELHREVVKYENQV